MSVIEKLHSCISKLIDGARNYASSKNISIDKSYLQVLHSALSASALIRNSTRYIARMFVGNSLMMAVDAIAKAPHGLEITIFLSVIFLYSLNLAFFGVGSRKIFTLFPLAVFFIYSFLRSLNSTVLNDLVTWIDSCIHSVDNPPTPEVAGVASNFSIGLLVISMIMVYFITSAYFVVKYLFFFYGMYNLWIFTVDSNPDKSIHFYFLIFGVLGLFIYMKIVYLLELVVNSFVFSLAGSLLLIQFLSPFDKNNYIGVFMNTVFGEGEIDLTSKCAVFYLVFLLLCLVVQLHDAMRVWVCANK